MKKIKEIVNIEKFILVGAESRREHPISFIMVNNNILKFVGNVLDLER